MGAGGIRRHATEGVAEERRDGGSGSGRRAGVGSGRGSPYTSLARAVTNSNIHLATIARYVEVLAGVGSDSDESDDESEEWMLGDEEVAHGLKKVMVNTWLDQDW